MDGSDNIEIQQLRIRLEKLETLLEDIALIADGHKASKLYVGGENVALVSIRNMASLGLGSEKCNVWGPHTTW